MKKFAVGCSVGIGIAVILMIIVAVTMSSSPDTKQSTPATPEPDTKQSTPATPEMDVSAVTLYTDYEANSIAADLKYKGKLLQVTGIATKIEVDILGDPIVMFGMDQFNLAGIYATFKKSELNNLANISVGQTITIIGTGNGKVMRILLEDCYMKN